VNKSNMSDAYVGTTVRLQPLCPLCQGSMEAGYLLDRGETNSLYQSEWHEHTLRLTARPAAPYTTVRSVTPRREKTP
jgi:hypothetical protein